MAKPPLGAAFVEGLDISAYGIARSLGPHGVPIYALTDGVRDHLRFSRYCREAFVFSDDPNQPRAYAGDRIANDEVLCQSMLEWSSRFAEKPALFATSDWFTRFLCRKQRELSPRFLFHWVAPGLLDSIIDKGAMAGFCERAGVRVPRTHVTRTQDDLAGVARGFVYPCLVKPIHRYVAGFPSDGAKVFVAQTPERLEAFFDQYPQAKGATLLQEVIEGDDDQVFQCTALLSTTGQVAAFSTVRKLQQYPPGYGSMCYGRAERNDELAEEALKVIRALGYRGLASLEFKYRASDGGYYFIEMNTRLPWYNGLFAAAGVNLAQLAYLDLHGNAAPVTDLATQRDGTTWLSYHAYAKWYRATRLRRPISLARFTATLAGSTSYAWWNSADPAPFVWSQLYGIRGSAGNLVRRLGGR